MLLGAALLVVGVAYVALSLLLIAFGANLAFFSISTWRWKSTPPTVESQTDGELPYVTVQLPIYNELYVSARVIDAAASLDYPPDRLQIQVIDDSTDLTVQIVTDAVARARDRGVDIHIIRRNDRAGYKAGALQNALATATGEFTAIFDADFIPPSDFLRRTIPHFEDNNIAFVQTRWGHVNREYSRLTRMQALAIDGHFLVEQNCRGQRGYWFNFNGTGGIWRKAAIEDAGGWTADTLTEDLDLSYRAHLRGWRAQYLEDVVVPGEIPAQMTGFRGQQHRWARGSLECARKLVPAVWRSDERFAVKYQATAHLTAYGIHLLLFALMLLYPLVSIAAERFDEFRTFFGVAYLFAVFSLAPPLFFIAGQRRQARPWLRELPSLIAITLIGPGLMVNTVRAAIGIFRDRNPEFERTPKYALSPGDDLANWAHHRYQGRPDRIVYAELGLAAYGFATTWLAYGHRNWSIMVYSAIFATGLTLVAGNTLLQSLMLYRHREARAKQVAREDARIAAAVTV